MSVALRCFSTLRAHLSPLSTCGHTIAALRCFQAQIAEPLLHYVDGKHVVMTACKAIVYLCSFHEHGWLLSLDRSSTVLYSLVDT